MFHPTILVISADDHLGKIDYATLSQQTLMELFVEPADTDVKKELLILDKNENIQPITEWNGPSCNQDEEVWRITFSYDSINALDFRWIPATVGTLNLQRCPLKGSIDLANLPGNMEEIEIGETELDGPIDLTCLPSKLTKLLLRQNQFTGPISMDSLPSELTEMDLSVNKLNGSVDISNLPEDLYKIDISRNEFSGSLNFGTGGHLVYFYANNNKFTGVADLREWRCTVGEIAVHKNLFSKILIVVKDRPATYVDGKDGCPIEDGEGNAVAHRSLVKS